MSVEDTTSQEPTHEGLRRRKSMYGDRSKTLAELVKEQVKQRKQDKLIAKERKKATKGLEVTGIPQVIGPKFIRRGRRMHL